MIKRLNPINSSLWLFMLFALSACVTINVYFPASQAERAAERIVDKILGEPEEKPEMDKSDTPEDKDAWNLSLSAHEMLAAFSAFLINDATAAQPDFSVNTPEIKRLEASMASRHRQLSSFYATGAIGFDKKGLVAIKNAKAVSLKERGKLNSLVKSENSDRNRLYSAIANANGHPEWENQVREVFAGKWAQKARSGWWYQTSSGSWKQK